MNLKVAHRSTRLTSPSIARQNVSAQLAVGIKRRMFTDVGTSADGIKRMVERQASGVHDFGLIVKDGEQRMVRNRAAPRATRIRSSAPRRRNPRWGFLTAALSGRIREFGTSDGNAKEDFEAHHQFRANHTWGRTRRETLGPYELQNRRKSKVGSGRKAARRRARVREG
jgi:hypothetical protein